MDAIHYHVRSEDQIVKKAVCIVIGVNLEGRKSVLAEIRDKKYPKISKSWRENWANLSTYFKFPEELRRLIYTTNAIEGFNRQLRKVTKSKAVFPTDDSCSRCCISPCWTSPKSGLAAGRTGRRYTLSSHCTTAAAFPNDSSSYLQLN